MTHLPRLLISRLTLDVRPSLSPRPKTKCLAAHVQSQYRQLSQVQTYQIPKLGVIKVHLDIDQNSVRSSCIGVGSSRGERPYQQDYVTTTSLDINDSELQRSIDLLQYPASLRHPDDRSFGHSQALCVGVIDGHGGSGCEAGSYVSENLPKIIEECDPSEVPKAIRAYREIGGYFRRFRGGYLENLGQKVYANQPTEMNMGERMSLAFLLTDQHLIRACPKGGAVATIALLCPLPSKHQSNRLPFFSSPLLSLTLAHVGDTSAMLCCAKTGKVHLLTESHHPDSRIESERLRRIGTGLITDSFGESRWGGTLANTRGLGDANFKKIGVTGEPDISNHILKGENWSFLAFVTDGISGVMSNQEIIDLCRDQSTPNQAAKNIIDFAEQLGARDNMTAVVVPLMKWGKVGGEDTTLERREYRIKQLSTQNTRQRRM